MVIHHARLGTSRAAIIGLVLGLVLPLVVLGTSATPAHAADVTIEVTTTADGAADGSDVICPSPGSGVQCTLRAAVQAANDAPADEHTIVLGAGTYVLDVTGADEDAAATGDLDVTGNIEVVGAGAGQTTIDASDLGDRIFDVADGSLRVEGVTLTGGSIGGHGGAIQAFGGASTITVVASALVDNRSFINSGGAIGLLDGATGVITDSTFRENSAQGTGGGILARSAEVAITGTTFEDNVSGRGGALAVNNSGATGTLTNSTLSGNTADRAGGGIFVQSDATLTVDSSTITANTVTDPDPGGDGIRTANNGVVTLRNSIVADNGVAGCLPSASGVIASDGHNLDSDDSCGLDIVDGDVPSGDADLAPLADNGGPTWTHALGAASDAIDAGSTDLAVDQRGMPRPFDGDEDGTATDDIGAIEQRPAGCDWRWTGAVSDAWDDAGNWDGPVGEVPGGPDDVVCLDDETNLPVVIDVPGGEVTIGALANTADIGGLGVRLDDGTLTLTGSSILDHLGLELAGEDAELVVDADLTVGGASQWSSGTLSGDGATTFASDLLITTGTPEVVDHHVIFAGDTSLDAEDPVRLAGSSIVENTGVLSIVDAGGFGVVFGGGDPLIRNTGTITKTGDDIVHILPGLENAASGVVAVEDGRLWIQGGGDNFGSVTVAQHSTVAFRGVSGPPTPTPFQHHAGSSVTGEGNVEAMAGAAPGFAVHGSYDVGRTRLLGSTGLFSSSLKLGPDADVVTGELSSGWAFIDGPGHITVTDGFDYEGGSLTQGALVDVGGDLDMTTSRNRTLFQASRILVAGDASHADGRLALRAGSEVAVTGSYTQTGGVILLDDASLTAATLDLTGEAELTGSGAVVADISNAGVLSPGTSPGVIDVDGDYTQDAAGHLDIELAGTDTTEFDHLTVTGDAVLDGTLTVTLLNGFDPSPGDEFAILTADSVTGTFDTVEVPATNGGDPLEVVYRPGAVVLTIASDEPEPAGLLERCDDAPDAFPDDDGSVHEPSIDCLAALGLLYGYPDGTVGPTDPVTRGQSAAIVLRTMQAVTGSSIDELCPDGGDPMIDGGATFGAEIACLNQLGVVTGYPDGTFRPGQAIARGQVATLLSGVRDALGFDLPVGDLDRFADVPAESVHAQATVDLAAAGVLEGYDGVHFGPGDPLTRGQLASVVHRLLSHIDAQGQVAG